MILNWKKIVYCLMIAEWLIESVRLEKKHELEQGYLVITEDYDQIGRCSSTFRFNSSLGWDHVYLDTETDHRRLIGVKKNTTELYLITFGFDTDHNTTKNLLIKKFDWEILIVDTKWIYDRVYILTGHKGQFRIYEADLEQMFIGLVTQDSSLNLNSPIFLAPDPFHGTITYSMEEKFVVLNSNYPNLNETGITDRPEFYSLEYASFLNESAICKIKNIKYLVSSTQIDGYDSVQTYYLVVGPSERNNTYHDRYFRCVLVNNVCDCIPNLLINQRKNLIKMYNYHKRNLCVSKSNQILDANKTIQLENKKTNFNNSINIYKHCLRICELPKWKKDIYASNDAQTPWEKYDCVNSMSMNTTLEEFGIARIPNQNSTFRLDIHFYKEFTDQLVTLNCSYLEMTFKFSIQYRILNNLADLNQPRAEIKNYKTISSIESTVGVDVQEGQMYEINPYIQTPLDARPHHIGTYVLDPLVTVEPEFVEPDFFKKLVLPLNAYIFSLTWSDYVASDFIYVSFYKHITSQNNLNTISYLLTDKNTNETSNQVLNDTINFVSCVPIGIDMLQVLFKISHLNENTRYNLRMLEKNPSGDIVSVSNMFNFKTLKNPFIQISKVYSDSIEVQIFLEVRLRHNDLNPNRLLIKNHNNNKQDIFYPFKIFITWEKKNTTNDWVSVHDTAVYESEFKNIDQDDQIDVNGHVEYGTYSAVIKLENLISSTHYSIKLDFEIFLYSDDSPPKETTILTSNVLNISTLSESNELQKVISVKSVIFLAVLVLFFACICIFIVYRNNKKKKWFLKILNKNENSLTPEEVELINKMNINLLYSFKVYENKVVSDELKKLNKLRESDVRFMNLIGKGAFGEVFKGKLKQNESSELTVAIKKLKGDADNQEKLDLLKEAISLNTFNHPNLINFYGVLFDPINEPKYIILEYMNMGDLLTYLRKSRPTKSVDYKKAIKISVDIAGGCHYLETKNYVHRDIAARNCLVNMNEDESVTVKIGDFGLAREVYSMHYYKQANDNKLLPIRWMAPEAIMDGLFTVKSDIWSFGIVLWELLTLGYQPYPGMDNQRVIEHIKNGGTLDIPDKCPKEIRKILTECWRIKATDRPSFKEILDNLMEINNYNAQYFINNSNVIPIYDDLFATETNAKSNVNHSDKLTGLKKLT